MVLGLFENKTKSKLVEATVPSNSTETETIELSKDVIIKHIEVRFYPGAQLDLQIEPKLIKDATDKTVDLVDYPGDKQHIEGDDDTIPLPTHVEASSDDKIEIKAENLDTNGNSYDYYVIIVLEEQ